jgi:hypothetical protein
MNPAERFWWLLTWFCVVWYMTVTVYVSLRGARDIRHMLARLEQERSRDAAEGAAPPRQTPSGSPDGEGV